MKAPLVLHASAVAIGSRGLLITGASGSGKSSLALQLIALGATLVADDGVVAAPTPEGALKISAPEPTQDMIEARGLGLVRIETKPAFAIAAMDLDQIETERLPPTREIVIAGVRLPALHRVESTAFPAMLIAYLKGGRVA